MSETKFPPLPDAAFTYERRPAGFEEPERVMAFTADQMRAYAEQYHREACAKQAGALYCLHIPGPDDVIAAPSKAEADEAANAYNAIMRKHFEGKPYGEFAPSVESCLAVVKEWPFDAGEHAEALADWNAEDWGVTKPAASEVKQAAELEAKLAAAEARIDELMLEHCPNEMTPEQMANWAKHQRVRGVSTRTVTTALAEHDAKGGA